MFEGCYALTILDVSKFDTSSVTNMYKMFENCSKLTTLDVSGWDTSSVTNMRSMFSGCSALTELNLGNFDLTKVTNVSSMLALSGSKIKKLILPGNFGGNSIELTTGSTLYNTETQELITRRTFTTGDEKLKLVVANTLTANANGGTISSSTGWAGTGNTATRYVGYDETISVLPTVTRTGYTFVNWNTMLDGSGTTITADSTLTGNTTIYAKWEKTPAYFNSDWQRLFENATGATYYDIKTIKFVNGETSSFAGASYFAVGSTARDNTTVNDGVIAYYKTDDGTYYDIEFVSPTGGTIYAPFDCSSLFYYSAALTSLDFSNFNTSSVINMNQMFFGCIELRSLDLSNWDTSSVTDMSNMFFGCMALTSLNVSNFNTSLVTDMNNMFGECYEIETIDVSSFNTSLVTSMLQMFKDCYNLTELNLGNFDLTKVTNVKNMLNLRTSNKINKIVLPKEFGSNSIPLTTGSTMCELGTQTKVVTGGTEVALTNAYKEKTLVRVNTLTANANGGTILASDGWTGTGNTSTRYVAYNETISVLPTVERDGYTFVGWNTNVSGTGTSITTASNISADTTINAIWEKDSYKITYDLGFDVEELDNAEQVKNNPDEYTIDTATFTLVNPTKAGYTFAGWSGTGIDGTASTVTINKGSVGDRSYKAVWMVEISIEQNGANGNTYNVTVVDSNKVSKTYTSNFSLIKDETYSIAVNATLKASDVNNNVYQIVRISLDEVYKVTETNLKNSSVDNYEVFNSKLTQAMKIKFEFMDAHKLTLETSTAIKGISVNAINSGVDVVIPYSTEKAYIVADGATVTFVVNTVPGSDDGTYSYTGVNYLIGETTKTVGPTGNEDITRSGFEHSDNYRNDPDIGTYTYTINKDKKVSHLAVQAVLSFTAPINNSAIATGTFTLTSQYGFNKVIDKDTGSIVLYNGTWTVTRSDLTYDQIQQVFNNTNIYTVTKTGDVITIEVKNS